jgi:MipA family protein
MVRLEPMVRLTLVAALLFPLSANAQQAPPPSSPAGPPDTVFDDNFVTVGIGAAAVPRYEGSDEYRLFPIPLLQGRVGGFDFAARGPGIALDLVRETPSGAVNIIAGPIVRGRFDRRGGFGDTRVRALGKRPVAVEVGAQLGMEWGGLRARGDALTLGLDVTQDVAGGHKGLQIAPSVAWRQPLGRATLAIASLSATRASGDYMRTYFSVDAPGSTASGLPTFAARSGWKDVGGGVILAHDLSGDARDGGWSLFGIARYTRLLNSAAQSPVTAIAGDADQMFVAAGVGYTF